MVESDSYKWCVKVFHVCPAFSCNAYPTTVTFDRDSYESSFCPHSDKILDLHSWGMPFGLS
jgi:hypothetical protein